MKKGKSLFTVLFVALMLINRIPVSVFAEETDPRRKKHDTVNFFVFFNSDRTGVLSADDLLNIPPMFNYDDQMDDLKIEIHPIYEVQALARLTFRHLNDISTESGGRSETAKFTSSDKTLYIPAQKEASAFPVSSPIPTKMIEVSETTIETVEAPTLPEENVRLSLKGEEKGWALSNLFCVLFTAFTAALMVRSFFRYRKEENGIEKYENEKSERSEYEWFLGILPALVSAVAFLFTEDVRSQRVLIDRYTLMMVIIAIINPILMYMTRRKEKEEKKKKENDLKLKKI